MRITFHTLPPDDADWRSADADDVAEGIEELELLLDDGPRALTLVFDTALPTGVSLPHYVRDVLTACEAQGYAGRLEVHVPSERVVSHLLRYVPADQRPRRSFEVGEVSLVVTVGDLASAQADAIVNASNRRLQLGGGVSHALRRRFGDNLQAQMRGVVRGEIEDGAGVVTAHDKETTGVGAIYHIASAEGSRSTIARGLGTVLSFATEREDRRVVLPALGTGTGGLAMEDFADELFDAAYGASPPCTLELWCWTRDDMDAVCRVCEDRLRRLTERPRGAPDP